MKSGQTFLASEGPVHVSVTCGWSLPLLAHAPIAHDIHLQQKFLKQDRQARANCHMAAGWS